MSSQAPRNLLTHYDDTLLAMAELEGDTWLLREVEDPADDYNAPGARERIVEELSYGQSLTGKAQSNVLLSPYALATIYGAGGVHRWKVTISGEVCFSAFHAGAWDSDGETLARATALGFKLW